MPARGAGHTRVMPGVAASMTTNNTSSIANTAGRGQLAPPCRGMRASPRLSQARAQRVRVRLHQSPYGVSAGVAHVR